MTSITPLGGRHAATEAGGQMSIEPVADADTMLGYLGGARPATSCSSPSRAAARATAALAATGPSYAELPTSPRILRAFPGARTTPQVFVDGKHIGGADELVAWVGTLG